jgi:DNA-binding transcriptional LysR family regulator
MRFDLRSLKSFIAVCEQQNIAHAAERECIAASAVSKRMSDLELTVRSPLFRRKARGLELTPSAQTLLRHARIIIRDLEQLEREVADHTSGARGLIRINASISPIAQHLPKDLASFLSRHVGARVEVEETTSEQVVQAVAENAADIGVFGGPYRAAGLKAYPYRSDTLMVIVPDDHSLAERRSLTLEDLLAHELIGPRKGSFLDFLMQSAATNFERKLDFRIRVGGFETVRGMVEARLGIGIVPENWARSYAAAGGIRAVPLNESWAHREFKICVLDVASLPPLVRLLLQHLSPEVDLATTKYNLVKPGDKE